MPADWRSHSKRLLSVLALTDSASHLLSILGAAVLAFQTSGLCLCLQPLSLFPLLMSSPPSPVSLFSSRSWRHTSVLPILGAPSPGTLSQPPALPGLLRLTSGISGHALWLPFLLCLQLLRTLEKSAHERKSSSLT